MIFGRKCGLPALGAALFCGLERRSMAARQPDIQPWERQKGEGEKPYEAFSIYRDMGEKRTVSAVVKKLGKSRCLIDRWKSQYRWSERVLAYDNYLARIDLEERKKGLREMRKRHIEAAQSIQDIVLHAFYGLDPDKLGPLTIKDFLKLSTDLERASREADICDDVELKKGVSVQGRKSTGTGDSLSAAEKERPPDLALSELTMEELTQLENIISKLAAIPGE